jgi:hypothetical protein
MKWKDIKLAAMQKMFSADGSNIPTDDSTQDYIAGMPYVANEALLMICTSKKYLIKSVDLDPSMGEEIGNYIRFNMKDVTDDFFEFYGEVYYTEAGGSHYRTRSYVTEAQSVFLVPKTYTGTWTVYYKAYPETITADTEDDYEINAPADVLAILPLYMASQLYKEDDNGIATSLRNEFEVAYDRLSQDNPLLVLEDENESGW